jgi:hypothetical protein
VRDDREATAARASLGLGGVPVARELFCEVAPESETEEVYGRGGVAIAQGTRQICDRVEECESEIGGGRHLVRDADTLDERVV